MSRVFFSYVAFKSLVKPKYMVICPSEKHIQASSSTPMLRGHTPTSIVVFLFYTQSCLAYRNLIQTNVFSSETYNLHHINWHGVIATYVSVTNIVGPRLLPIIDV